MSEKSLVGTHLLPASIRPWADKAVAWAKGLSRPARVLLVTTAIALVIGSLVFHSTGPTYVVLFSNLERDDAAAIVPKLKEMKVPYRLEGDGSTIEVPEAQARDLRLELAASGMPRGGAVGFESFDKLRLGATDFEQRVLYRRSLEGELARTIGTVGAVQTARVHLVLPEKSVFVSKNEPSSASVVLKLRGGRALGGGEVAGIVHLVSTAVVGLSPDRVAVVTTDGTVLHKPKRPSEDGVGDDDRAAQTRALEASLEERARAIVEKVMGPGHVDVRVTADVDSSRVERVEDHYDPRQSALRSEERSVERTGDDVPVAGVPGAESNLPTGSARGAAVADGGAPTAASGNSRESHTRNFEVDHITEKRVVTGGVLRRLTVAVVLDGAPAQRSKEETDKIGSLVRSAVGFDEKRGDVVTVEAVPFLATESPPVPPSTSLPFEAKKAAPIAGGAALVLLIAIAWVVRSSREKKKQATALALAQVAERERASVQVEVLKREAALVESPDDLQKRVRERAMLDPATAAVVVRAWLGSAETRATQEEAA